jgi:type IV secretory pathway TrbD component
MDTATFIAVIRVGMGVLTDRLLTVLALWMSFGLAVWAMYNPNVDRLQIAAGFGIIVYLPALIKERPRDRKQQTDPPGVD